jgi:hypothetical protein
MNRCLLTITTLLGLVLLPAGLQAGSVKGIVSLDLCTDWMLLKFADPAQVRAYSPLLYKYHADWVPLDLPVHDGSLEHILQLEPELLISGEYNALLLRKRLQQLGKKVEVLALPTTLDSIRAYQAEFLRLIGANEGSGAVGWNRTYPSRHQSLLLLGASVPTGSVPAPIPLKTTCCARQAGLTISMPMATSACRWSASSPILRMRSTHRRRYRIRWRTCLFATPQSSRLCR